MPNWLAECQWIPEAARRRLPVEFPVAITPAEGGQREMGSVANMGPTGLFVASRALFPVETLLQISFCLPLAAGPRLVVTTACVRWVSDGRDPRAAELPRGMGLELTELDPRSRTDIEAFLAELAAPARPR